MKPTNNTYLFFLENEGVLFHEGSQKIFHLNTMATFVWCMLEDDINETAIRKKLQLTYKLSKQQTEDYYQKTKQLFQSLGVIQGYEGTSTSQIEDNRIIEAPGYNENIFVTQSHYRLLSSRVCMRFSSFAQKVLVDPVLQHLLDDDDIEITATIDIVESDGLIQLYRDEIQLMHCEKLIELAPKAKSLLWQTVLIEHDFFLDIHAGVVGDGHQCFIFPAAPGSGKSTLTAALVFHGFEYFSDEIALLHETNLWVEAVPLATCIKDTGTKVMSQFYPQLNDITLHQRGDGKRVRYIPPPDEARPPAGTIRPVGAIIFPQYDAEKKTELVAINKLQTFELIMQECLMVDSHLDKDKVINLLDWINRTPCYSLTTTDLSKAVKLIEDLSKKLHMH
ncbi:MAG: PqqD family peptide modification chaperone [Gammaproteobacteria bacterium]|nr:PqqD family peptide modification chaperone [Gammaproteobacteria bacterium]